MGVTAMTDNQRKAYEWAKEHSDYSSKGARCAHELVGLVDELMAAMLHVVRCKDCEHQRKVWHADKRRKNGGFWIYSCDKNEDQFVYHVVDGYDTDFCSYGKRKVGDSK